MSGSDRTPVPAYRMTPFGGLPSISISAEALAALPDAPWKTLATGPLAAVLSTIAPATSSAPLRALRTGAAIKAGVAAIPRGPSAGPPIRNPERLRRWQEQRQFAAKSALTSAKTARQVTEIVAAYEREIERGADHLKIRSGSKLNWLPDLAVAYTAEALRALARTVERTLAREYAERCKANEGDGRRHSQRRHAVPVVLQHLIDGYQQNDGFLFETRARIAAAIGRGVRTLDSALRWLEARGFVKRTRRRVRKLVDGIWREHQTSNVYELILPPGAARRVGILMPPNERLTRPVPSSIVRQSAVTAHLKEHGRLSDQISEQNSRRSPRLDPEPPHKR